MADVTLRHVYKVYEGGVRAVNDFDLEIKDKEFIVFVGPSGCGKSTTLRMIAGLEEITAGQLYIDGELMNEVEPKNRDIAMVFQSYALYPHMTVYDNMAFGLKLRHIPKEEIDERVKKAAEILEISELLTRKPKALSGGQRQRVALGRTIVRHPKVFLLDEPLSNLDAKLRVSMRSEITKLHDKLETTFIYVTHDQTEAMTMGNRIVVMKNGFVQQVDTPVTLFEDPCNLFVATFLGSPQMNIINAELSLDGDILKAKLNDDENALVVFPDIKRKELSNKNYIGQKVLLGIRPEHIKINEGNIKVHIDVVEHLGDESIIYCSMENRKDPFVIKLSFNNKIKANQDIYIDIDMNKVYLFDKDNHKSINGIPYENEFLVNINKDILLLGDQRLILDEEYTNHLLDTAFINDVHLAIKPDYISIKEIPNSLKINAKLEFIEPKTDYQALYFSLKGLDGYYALKINNEEKVNLGKEVNLYLPYQKLRVLDYAHNKINSRETIYPNNNNYKNGEYEIIFSQDKLIPLYSKKVLKKNKNLKNIKCSGNKIKVDAYDEDILGNKLLIYVQLKGFDKYSSFVVENTFSVYKMPKFELFVPQDAFTLSKLDSEKK